MRYGYTISFTAPPNALCLGTCRKLTGAYRSNRCNAAYVISKVGTERVKRCSTQGTTAKEDLERLAHVSQHTAPIWGPSVCAKDTAKDHRGAKLLFKCDDEPVVEVTP